MKKIEDSVNAVTLERLNDLGYVEIRIPVTCTGEIIATLNRYQLEEFINAKRGEQICMINKNIVETNINNPDYISYSGTIDKEKLNLNNK